MMLSEMRKFDNGHPWKDQRDVGRWFEETGRSEGYQAGIHPF